MSGTRKGLLSGPDACDGCGYDGKKNWLFVAIVVAGVLLAWRWYGHTPTEADDHDPSVSSADPPAAVVRVERRTIANTLKISGEFKPFQDVDVHAKVAGYIKAIYVDVGSHVKEGQEMLPPRAQTFFWQSIRLFTIRWTPRPWSASRKTPNSVHA